MNTALATELATIYCQRFTPVLCGRLSYAYGIAWKHEDTGQQCITISSDAPDKLHTLLHEIRHHQRGDVIKPRTETRRGDDIRAGLDADTIAEFDKIIDAREDDCELWAETEAAKLRAVHPEIDRLLE